MKYTKGIFWLIWSLGLCYLIALLFSINHGRGIAGGNLMLFSQIFLFVAIALCSQRSKRMAIVNTIVAVIVNTSLFLWFIGTGGEGHRLLLMFIMILFNGCQGVGVLLYKLVKKG